MKNEILLFAVALFLTSCAIQYQESCKVLDFRPYLAEGFVISPADYMNKSYQCLANISLEVVPGKKISYVKVSTPTGKGMVDKEYRTNYNPTPDELLEKLVKYAKEFGGNGILGLQTKMTNNPVVYELSGVVIKISEK